jgi:tubulin polyglutamylase TTLL2
LLLGGYKFDLRLYVVVKCMHPLTVYLHKQGLCRFSTEKYNEGDYNNMYSHLTNASINKFSPSYDSDKAGG